MFAAMQQKKFVNRGLVNGPFCVLYGITSVLITVGLQELDGYICISASAFWGALGFVVVRWGNGLTLLLLSVLPAFFMQILLLVLVGILALDIFASAMLLWGKSRNPKRWEAADAEIDKVREPLGAKIAGMVQKRIRLFFSEKRICRTDFSNVLIFVQENN